MEYTRIYRSDPARRGFMLDLHLEVVNLQEINDILDEIKMLSNVKQEQFRVVKSFTGHIHEPRIRQRFNALLDGIQDHISELKRLEENAANTSTAVCYPSVYPMDAYHT